MTNRWAVLAILCLARMSMGLHLQVVAAVAPFLIAGLGLSYTEIGLLIGLFMLPGALLAIPGGLVSRRAGDKATLLGGLALLTVGTGLLALSHDFALAAVARLVSGAGGTLLTMQVAKIATDWFAGRELATAIGLLLGTFPLGIALAMAGLGGLAAVSSWRLALAAPAASALLILGLVALLYRDLPRPPTAADAPSPRLWAIAPRELRLVVVAGVAWALVNAAFVVFPSFTTPLLIAQGRSESQAGVLASWASLVSIGSFVVAGYLLDRAGRTTAWLVVSAVLTAGTCLAVPIWEPTWLWIVLFGAATAPVVVGIMALPGEVLGADSRNTGFGVFFTMNYIGFGLLPPVAGYLLDVTGSPAAPLWFGGTLYLSIVPFLLIFRRLQRRPARTAAAASVAAPSPSA